MEKRKIETVVEFVRAGHGAKAIKAITRYASSTVYDVVKAFGYVSKKLHDRSGTKKKDADLLSRLKAIGNGQSRNPHVTGLPSPGLSRSSISNLRSAARPIVDREDEGGQIEEVQKGVELIEFGYLSTSEILLRREDFTVDRSSNRQNDRWLAKTKKSFRSKNPASVMVLGIVSTALDAGEKINIDVYLGVLKEASGDVYNGR
ncbi:Transposable element tcb2 transposase [Caligus rogercresseyi]|uniref:Transposable element tcb2 transposase n=1 Tax=Caligus rogercresseyi TaxID=217165 RepID=A0A7T8KDA9_CALRO|nr:Transposable element tcb2 transposase [Caligus rogercresseyi]